MIHVRRLFNFLFVTPTPSLLAAKPAKEGGSGPPGGPVMVSLEGGLVIVISLSLQLIRVWSDFTGQKRSGKYASQSGEI